MIGLDAAEPALVEAWTADGTLPNLKALIQRGVYGRLASPAEWLSGSPWPTFYTGTGPGDHGLYHYLAWHPDRMEAARPTPDRLPLDHFWRELAAQGPCVLAVDVPRVYAPPPFNGIEISGWGTDETFVSTRGSPPSILKWASATFGPRPCAREIHLLLSLERLLAIGAEEQQLTKRMTEIAETLLRRRTWDLALLCLASTHRAGHKLWDETGISDPAGPEEGARIHAALRDVYVAVDEAVGRLVQVAGADWTLVFSVHGMGPNTSRTELIPQLLDHVLADGGGRPAEGAGRRRVHRLRAVMPERWRHVIKRRLPMSTQDRLTAFWRHGAIDWSETRAFCMVADLQGYIRVNLRGREAQGIVEPGNEYEDLCRRIAEGLMTFVDADTGEPIVREVRRAHEICREGPRRDRLPDLVVNWSHTPAAAHREIVSPMYECIPWPSPGKNPSGRSGNHSPDGFVVATGSGFPAGGRLAAAQVADLAPTVFRFFGLPAPERMRGADLAERLADEGRRGGNAD